MFKLVGLHHPFFRPLIRRILTLGVIVAWGLYEWLLGYGGWAIFCGYLAVFCALAFFIFPDPDINEDDDA